VFAENLCFKVAMWIVPDNQILVWVRMKNIITAVILAGTSHTVDGRSARRIRLTNVLALVCITYLAVRGGVHFMISPAYSYALWFVAVILIGVPVLNYFRFHTLAKFIMVIVSNGAILILGVYYLNGTMIGTQVLFVIAVMFPMYIYRLEERGWIALSVFVTVAGVASMIYLNQVMPIETVLEPGSLYQIRLSVALFGIVLAFIVAFFFNYTNNRSEFKLELLNLQLQQRTQELELERTELAEKNLLLDNDLYMARMIQKQLLPQTPPDHRIAYYYKFQQKLGGDFFDIFNIDGGSKFGVFLSDVSGHGVTSSFITLMIKNILHQNIALLDQPGALLDLLNERLKGQTAGNFVTAFYGVIDFEKPSITFSCAGQNSPYRISTSLLEELPMKVRRPPLGVDIESAPVLKYPECRYELVEGDRIFIYTDGVVEATPSDATSPEYGDERLEKLLARISDKRPDQMIQSLVQDMNSFRGSDRYDDDLCAVFVAVE